MKKKYCSPVTYIELITEQDFIAASPSAVLDPNETIDAENIEVRNFIFWDALED